jgi:hypothetical protein
MIISFICWLIGMNVLKDYGWEFKDNLGIAMCISGLLEFVLYFTLLLRWIL